MNRPTLGTIWALMPALPPARGTTTGTTDCFRPLAQYGDESDDEAEDMAAEAWPADYDEFTQGPDVPMWKG